MKTDPGTQSTFPWFEGPQQLQPVNLAPLPYTDPFDDPCPHPEALGLRVLAIFKWSH
jgi:hypothetical protein